MSLTIKESPESTSQGKPGSPSQNSENKSGASPRSNPVCLEVSVTVRSLPGENVDVTGSTGPIREEGRTVIVFDNGAVLRLSNNLPAGLKIILSNAQGDDIVCKVVNGRNLPTVRGYIEVEFIEQFNDFWRIHQTAAPVIAPPPPTSATIASPKPFPVVPLATPPVVAPAAPQAASPEKEVTSTPGNAPSFEDIAGVVRMSPPPAASAKARESASQMGAVKGKPESAYSQGESLKSMDSFSAPNPVQEMPSVRRATPAAQEFTSSTQKPALSNDFMARGMLASGQMSSSPSQGEGRGRMGMILGVAAVVLAACGGGYFYVYRGSAPAPASTTASQQPVSLSPAQSTSNLAAQAPPTGIEPAPAQPLPVLASAAPEAAAPSAPEAQNARRKPNNATDVNQENRIPKQREQLPNLKISSPTMPRQNLAKLSDGAAPSVTDVSSPIAAGNAPAAGMLSPIVRTENQPAPPQPLSPAVPSVKSVREPKLLTSTRPEYPSVARQSNTQGTVVVTAEVDLKGNVVTAQAVSGPPSLRQAATDAVKHWRYSPALIDGKPAPAQVTVNVQFRLN